MKQISCAFIIFRYVWILVNCGMFLMCEGRGQTTPVCWVCWQSCPRSDPVEAVREECSVIHTHTHTCLTALFPGLPGWAGTRKVKSVWISLKQETLSDSGIGWALCKSAPRSRQITTPVPHHLVFLQALCPSCRPANSVKALKALVSKQVSF